MKTSPRSAAVIPDFFDGLRTFAILVLASAALVAGDVVVTAAKPSQSAVGDSLQFLSRHQSADGAWHAATPGSCGDTCTCPKGVATADEDLHLTALITLGFLGAGYDHVTPHRYQALMTRTMAGLTARQQADGSFSADTRTHALVTMAICEAFAMTRDTTLKPRAQAAVTNLLARRLHYADQQPAPWGDAATGLIDTETTCLATMACKSARGAELDAQDGLEVAYRWCEQVMRPLLATPRSLTDATDFPFPATWSLANATGQGVAAIDGLIIVLFASPHADRRLDPLFRSLIQPLKADPRRSVMTCMTDYRRLWLATLGAFQYGHQTWTIWMGTMIETLFPRGITTCTGFHYPSEGQPHQQTGPLLATAYALLGTEVLYRYKHVGNDKPPAAPPEQPQVQPATGANNF